VLDIVKTIGRSFINLVPSQKTLRPPGVPSWLRAWAKPSGGLTNNRDVTVDPEMVIDEFFKKKRRLNFIF